jgi:DNA topoisomerase VI subunit B
VSDTGIGIPRKYHSVVFERFRQVDSTGTREYGGTGLGLSICKAYVELLGGSIRVNSTPGEGSVFYFTLPYSVSSLPLQVTEKESASPQQENVNNMYSILVVEDEDLNFLLIDELLSGLEHKTIRAKGRLDCVGIIPE